MKILISLVIFLITTSAYAEMYNIRTFGAVGDGKNIDSPAINKAITEAKKNGGGTIYIPAGTYACYSIRLESNISIYLETGATILAAYPTKDVGYDAPEENPNNPFQDFGHSHWHNSLIWGEEIENVLIYGGGTIYGLGLTREESRLVGVANKAIGLKNCHNITLRDFTMLRCGHCALLATGVDNLIIANLRVDTNRDGFDIDCCRNVRVSDCSLNCPWDDAIVLKSSYGLARFKDTQNVTINSCYVSGFDQGSAYSATWETDIPQAPDHGYSCGRIKLGTESSGGFKNIAITNCVFERSRGLALEAVDGGLLEDVVINNITMRDIVNAPIFMRLGARQRSPKGTPVGAMRRIRISNINVYNAESRYACILSGIPEHCIEDIYLSNIFIWYKGGYSAESANIELPENEKTYPEPWMFGDVVPASGFYLRHLRGVNMENINFYYQTKDERPLFVFKDVETGTISNIKKDFKSIEDITF